jgi:hypothetical protein
MISGIFIHRDIALYQVIKKKKMSPRGEAFFKHLLCTMFSIVPFIKASDMTKPKN